MQRKLNIVEIDDDVKMMPLAYLVNRYLVDNGIVIGRAMMGQYNTQLVDAPETNLPYAACFIEYSWIQQPDNRIIDVCSYYRKGVKQLDLTPQPVTDCYSQSVDPTAVQVTLNGSHNVAGEYFTLMPGLEQEAVTSILKLDKVISRLTMTEIAILASLPLTAMMGFERLVVRMLIKHNMSSIMTREQKTLISGR